MLLYTNVSKCLDILGLLAILNVVVLDAIV